jgi:hypothetical protein
LNATANVAGTFTYSPPAGTVLNGGGRTLTATFIPSDVGHYSSATASVEVEVSRATPTVVWNPPSSMGQGSALGSDQLNAEASIPGVFTYDPPTGTILPQGVQRLAVNFSPRDSVDYLSITKYRSISVVPSTPIPSGCGGPTINLNNGMSQSTLQGTISSAPNCSLIVFAPGTYDITSPLQIPCNNLQIAGPVALPPTALLVASYTGNTVFSYGGGCATLGAVTYLQFENTGAVYVGIGNNSNFTFEYNAVTNLPAVVSAAGGIYSTSESGVFLDGNLTNTTKNVLIEYNTFGDASSCAATFVTSGDQGGSCAGVLTHTGELENLTINYNRIYHVEEGIHLLQLAAFAPGALQSVCVSCNIEYNYIWNYHRIGTEIQIGTPSNPILFEHNAIVDPVNSYWGTFATSFACCQAGFTDGVPGFSPGVIINDNVLVSTLPIGTSGWPPPFGIEFWGTGSIGERNLVQGTFSRGISWGFGAGAWQISYNYICGSYMAVGNSYISNEEGTANPPTQLGNTTAPVCVPSTSKPPVISSAGGPRSQVVTLSDPAENTGIWYTTDGSTPVPGSGTARFYTAPFTVPVGTTVKAVGMWGTANQPVSYPAGYGYVPSSVVSASFASSSAVKRPGPQVSSIRNGSETQTGSATQVQGQVPATPQTLTIAPPSPVLAVGGTTQLKAVATFSDGSTKDITSQVVWKSSDIRTILVDSSGTLTGLATGQALLTGSWQGQQTAVLASSTVGEIEWSGPIVITQGGTYSGNWQSTDAKMPAVTVVTTDPVILQGAHMRSASDLIRVNVEGADLTVRNSLGVALNAAVKGRPNGVFLNAAAPARLDVENNYLENVREGVLVRGYSGSRSEKETLIIRGNRARNLNGLLSDGVAGYQPGEGANRSSSRFVELDNVQSVPGIDVGWNEVINYPGQSLVSDVINVYRSSGTPNHPLDIHDEFIQGAYPYEPARDAFKGGGIKTDGALDDKPENATAFTYIHDNQVVGAVGYGIQFGAGHDNVAANNRVISSGLLADGTKIRAQQKGLIGADENGKDVSSIYNNTMHDNLVGWTCLSSTCSDEGSRGALSFPAAPGDYSTNSVVPAEQITLEMEEREYGIWLNKIASVGIKLGPSF